MLKRVTNEALIGQGPFDIYLKDYCNGCIDSYFQLQKQNLVMNWRNLTHRENNQLLV